jgi:hypothetical protein
MPDHPKPADTATAAQAEAKAIAAWLRSHGLRQIADAVERGDYKR